MKILRKILTVLIVTLCLGGVAFGAVSNLPAADIGDFGTWATENNQKRFTSNLSDDVNQFQKRFQEQVVDNYVPIEAKVGMAFVNAFSLVAHVLDTSFVRFVILFIILAFAFWTMFEAYTIIV